MKGRSKSETIEGVRFDIQELKIGDILDWEQEIERQISENKVSATDQLLVEDFSLTDIAKMLGKSVEDLRDLPPSVAEHLAAHCKEINSHFFQLRVKLVGPLKSALELARWVNPSLPSSEPVTRKPGIIRSLFSWLSSKS
jgi:hypothetical protein